VVPETTVEAVPRRDGTITAYCVQPVLAKPSLLPVRLKVADPGEVREMAATLVERIAGCIDSRLGLDAQLSNWAWGEGDLRFLDISTPFVRDERGRESFDVELHLASVPWALRGAVRRFALGAILDKYYDVRALCSISRQPPQGAAGESRAGLPRGREPGRGAAITATRRLTTTVRRPDVGAPAAAATRRPMVAADRSPPAVSLPAARHDRALSPDVPSSEAGAEADRLPTSLWLRRDKSPLASP